MKKAMSEAGPTIDPRPFHVSLFSLMGRIGPGRYWLSVICAAVLLAGAVMFTALASDPRGSGGGLLLAIPLLVASFWVLAAAFAQRLRDARKHPVVGIVALFMLIGALFLSLALMETAPWLGLIAALGILAVIGHIDTIFKPASPAE